MTPASLPARTRVPSGATATLSTDSLPSPYFLTSLLVDRSHIRHVLSLAPETRNLPSAVIASPRTATVCPSREPACWPVFRSQMRMELSPPAVYAFAPSGVTARLPTHAPCP